MATTNPLTAEHKQQIKSALRILHDAQSLMDKAESCGTDCQILREKAAQYSARLTKFLETFWPGETT
jgi:hypothetical protein